MPFNLTASELSKYLPNFAANYSKRFLERGYDQAFKNKFGQWIVGLSPWKKYSLEAILYAVTTVLDDRLPANSLFKKYASQVGLDAAPELSKRMINGARDEIVAMAATARNTEEKELIFIIFSLDDKDISDLIRWLGQTKLERDKILGRFSLFSTEQKAKFLRLSDEDKEKLAEIFGPKEKAEQVPSEPTSGEVFRRDMIKAADRLREIKERMRQRRKRGRQ